jgi:hypothetical protein
MNQGRLLVEKHNMDVQVVLVLNHDKFHLSKAMEAPFIWG